MRLAARAGIDSFYSYYYPKEFPQDAQIFRRARSADFQSAVSQVFNLQVARQIARARWWLRSADCKSAIQQSATLRYFGCGCASLCSFVVKAYCPE
jgi:hypothetical protein